MPPDWGDLIKTYGLWVVVFLLVGWEVIKALGARSAAQNKRDESQDQREGGILDSFKQVVKVFQDTTTAAAESNRRAAEVYDRVTAREDENAKLIANAFKEAAEQRAEQLIQLKAQNAALLNPRPRFAFLAEDVNQPIIASVEGTVMEIKNNILEELRAIREEMRKENLAVMTKIDDLMERIKGAPPTTAAPQQTVTLNVTPAVPIDTSQAVPVETSKPDMPITPAKPDVSSDEKEKVSEP